MNNLKSELNDELNKMKEICRDLNLNLKEMQYKYNTLMGQYNENIKKLNCTEKLYGEVKLNYDQILEEDKEIKDRNDKLFEENNNINYNLKLSEEEISNYKNKLDCLNKDFTELQKKYNEIVIHLEETNNTMEKNNNENNDLNAQIKELENELNELKNNYDQLNLDYNHVLTENEELNKGLLINKKI